MEMIVQINPKTKIWTTAKLETEYRTIYQVHLDLPEADFDFDGIISMVSHLTGVDLVNANETAHYSAHNSTYAVQVHHAPEYRENIIRRAKDGACYAVASQYTFDYSRARQGIGYFLPGIDELWLEDQDGLVDEIMNDALDEAIRFFVDEAGAILLTEKQADS